MSLSRAFAAIPRSPDASAAPLLGRLSGASSMAPSVRPAAAPPPSMGSADVRPVAGEQDGTGFLPALSVQARCRAVRQVTAEMVALVADRMSFRRDRRRASTHIRQISMYVCHVVLQLSLTEIGTAFGRDRTTVGHACNVVEDRRDDPTFDDFVSAVERVVAAVFGIAGSGDHA